MINRFGTAFVALGLLLTQAASAGTVTLGWDKQWQHQTGQSFTHSLSDAADLVANGNVLSNAHLTVWALSDFHHSSEYISSVSIDGTVLGSNIDSGHANMTANEKPLHWGKLGYNTRLFKLGFDLDDGLFNGLMGDSMASIIVDFSDSVHALACNYYSKVKLTFDYEPGGTITDVDDIAAVPLPAAVWLFGTALFGFAGVRFKRRT